MISVAPKLTDAGKSLLIRSISGEQITFTKFRIGNGELNSENEAGLLNILNPVVEFGIESITAHDEGYVELTGSFTSSDITGDFRWTELGVFAHGEDGSEVLYAYANDDDNAGILKANTSDVVIEQSVSVIVAVGEASNITALVTPSLIYASKPEFDAHVSNKYNPHKVTAEMIGLGNVQNFSTNGQIPTFEVPVNPATQEIVSGDDMSTLMSKIARAIMNLISHIANINNPHKVTAEQAGAAAKKHGHSAADINTGILGTSRGGTGMSLNSIEELKAILSAGIVTGVYDGDDTVKRHIELGFRPAAVLLMPRLGMAHSSGSQEIYGGLCVGEYGVVSAMCSVQSHETEWNNPHTAALISDTGFWVNYQASYKVYTNKSGMSYRYIAWR